MACGCLYLSLCFSRSCVSRLLLLACSTKKNASMREKEVCVPCKLARSLLLYVGGAGSNFLVTINCPGGTFDRI